jgi:hypothetical protein
MNYTVVQSRTDLDEWIAEAIDHASEGEIYVATFSGLHARSRANEYAAWMNSRQSGDRAEV